MTPGARRRLALAVALVAATAALYVPFLRNPFVFDDLIFFNGWRFGYYATHPLGPELRLPAYFSLAMTQVFTGSLAVHRAVSLVLHAVVALLLYRLLMDVQRAALPASADADLALRAAIGAAAFALHPVAVYGAGYLVQRTIVLATLFGLACAILFLRGLRRRSRADALSAALFYSLAVLSKEHAVLLPAALLPLVPLAGADRGFSLRQAALFAAASAPAAIFVVVRSLYAIGGAYEGAAGAVAAQIDPGDALELLEQSLALSAVTQAGLFFKYAGLWLWPDPGAMSIDLRVDFAAGWTPGWIAAKVAGFAACGALGFALLVRGGPTGIAGFGLLYAWILYFVEFTTVRFQEPFVLYRSYLWGPGMVCIAVGGLARLPRYAAIVAGLLGLAVLAAVAHGRLETFSHPLRLWEDAAAKLPSSPVPWGSRTLYGLGREYLYSGQAQKALETVVRCEQLYPRAVQCAYARGAVHLQLREFEEAVRHLGRAIALEPDSAIMHHRLGLALECQGRRAEAEASYRRSQALGYGGAQVELQRMLAPEAQRHLPPACG